MSRIPVDLKGLVLYCSYCLINLSVNFAAIDLKIIVQLIGSIAGLSTILYNIIKMWGEISKMIKSVRWRKVRKRTEVKEDAGDEEIKTPKP